MWIQKFIFSSGNKRINKDIDIRIERVIEDGEDLTNVVVKGTGILPEKS